MSTARDTILARLNAAAKVRPLHANPGTETEAQWLARQPPVGDLSERFIQEQQAVGSEVRRVAGFNALADIVPDWLVQHEVRSIITGTAPALNPLREALQGDGRFTLHRFDRPVEEQRELLFSVDCGITTSRGGVAETGSVVLMPSSEEPRLLSLAPPVHLVLLQADRLLPRLSDFIASGVYQDEMPANLVLVSGASRTADIELILAMGVHGPRLFLVALIE